MNINYYYEGIRLSFRLLVNVALYEDHPDDEEVINMTLEPDENYIPDTDEDS